MGAKEAKCWTGENWTRGGVGEGGGGVTGPDTVVRVVRTAGAGEAGFSVRVAGTVDILLHCRRY